MQKSGYFNRYTQNGKYGRALPDSGVHSPLQASRDVAHSPSNMVNTRPPASRSAGVTHDTHHHQPHTQEQTQLGSQPWESQEVRDKLAKVVTTWRRILQHFGLENCQDPARFRKAKEALLREASRADIHGNHRQLLT